MAYTLVVIVAVVWAHLSSQSEEGPADRGDAAGAVVADGASVWTGDSAGIARFAATRLDRPAATAPVRATVSDLAVTATGALVVSDEGIRVLDARTLRAIGSPLPDSGGAWQLAAIGDVVAAVQSRGRRLQLVDPVQGTVRWRVDACRDGAVDLTAIGDTIWVTCLGRRTVGRVTNNPGGAGEVAVFAVDDGRRVAGPRIVGRWPRSIAGTSTVVWIADPRDRTLTRLAVQPPFQPTERLPLAGAPRLLAVSGSSLWVAYEDPPTVEQRDSGSGAQTGRVVQLGAAPVALAPSGDGVVVVLRNGQVRRLAP